MRTNLNKEKLAIDIFREAEEAVVQAGYGWEAEWLRNLDFNTFSETEFLRETAWVILCSGFKEATVRNKFDYISLCFCDWESTEAILACQRECIETALVGFRNQRKLKAIVTIADQVYSSGFDDFRLEVIKSPILRLQQLPYIGPITSWHLAKNLGLDVAKNDRHLARIATQCGYPDAHVFCNIISNHTGYTCSVIDVIIWRFCALARGKSTEMA